ncbi:TetR/AcrR family transcriptional regulator [Paraburkholderia sp. GAS448]|uniref:TetR/AcrR family transcriptional regulator n=1 Tax=Paraburkholderia sp. GAS448 TaxID=3035136 RepID=UPI003D236B44
MAVLDEATVEFNRSGVAGASLTAIARRVGLGRAALYNYCIDRQDLVYQCYSRSIALLREDLDRAAQANANGLGKVVTFLRLALDSSINQPRAVLTELAFLSQTQQDLVENLRSENVEALALLIREGIKDKSIRNCDVEVVCQAILGILSWSTLSLLWISAPDEDFAGRMANAIPDLITDGMASEGMEVLPSRQRIQDVIQNPHVSDWDDRRELLALVASRLFNSRGIDGVSLDDVALELGATKGVVYHYFQSKPALVAYCYERAFNIYEQIMSVAENGSTGLECTVIAIELNVEAQLEDISPLWMSTGAEMLSKQLQKEIVRRAGELWARSVKLAERGVRDGSLRRLDFEPVKQASAGSFNYLISSKDNGKRSVSDVAAEISRLLLLGLRPHKTSLNSEQASYRTL